MGTPINYSKGGSGFEPLPEGTYDFKINAAKQGTSKNGNGQLALTLEVIDGDHAGKTMMTWYSLVEAATFRIDKLLDAVGVERVDTGEKSETGIPVLSFDLEELPGRMFRCDLSHRTYEGRVQADLKNEGPSSFAAGGQKPTAGGTQTQAAAPAAPSTTGAPVQQRRPRPAPAS